MGSKDTANVVVALHNIFLEELENMRDLASIHGNEEEISPPFSPRAGVCTAVFAWNGRLGLAKGMGEGFGGGLVIGGRFGLGGLRQCGCAAVWPLEV